MDPIRNNTNEKLQELLKQQREATNTQRKAMQEASKNIDNPEFKKYMKQVDKAMNSADQLDSFTINMLKKNSEMLEGGVKKAEKSGIGSFLKNIVKSLFR